MFDITELLAASHHRSPLYESHEPAAKADLFSPHYPDHHDNFSPQTNMLNSILGLDTRPTEPAHASLVEADLKAMLFAKNRPQSPFDKNSNLGT